jgi:hypothetical protein
VTAAVITASASIVVAVLVFVLNQRAMANAERRRAGLERVERQLRELYGPLHAMVTANEELWRRLHENYLPAQEVRRSGSATTPAQARQWQVVLEHALMPANRQMRDLLVAHADLLVETDMPAPLREFCAHVAAYEIQVAAEAAGVTVPLVVPHPGDSFAGYLAETYAALKRRQAALLPRTAAYDVVVRSSGASGPPPRV